jgi:hypothetical protein
VTARPAVNVHDRIVAECSAIQAAPVAAGNDLAAYPHALALIESAIAAIENVIPDHFDHEGRSYRLRVLLQRIDLGIHADASSATPMLRLQTEGLRWCGHRPGH